MTFEFAFCDKIKRNAFWQKRRKKPNCIRQMPKYDKLYSRASFLVWQEHCVECSPPDCYMACLLYEPGVTVDCRRFAYGIFLDKHCLGLQGYGAEIFFKRWAKLEAVYSATLIPLNRLKVLENIYKFLVIWIKNVSYLRFFLFKRHIYPRFKILQTKFFLWCNRMNAQKADKNRYPDCFVLDVINMEETALDIRISFTRKAGMENHTYNEVISLEPGFNHHTIDYNKIILALTDLQECLIAITTVNDVQALLEFTALDFVNVKDKKHKLARPDNSRNVVKRKPKVKCLVFDLDNTLWDGAILVDGHAGIRPKVKAKALVRKLDERGILLSIASKNDFESAQKVLAEIDMEDYFLFPQIHWGLKSESIKRIAKLLNIGIDSIAFIDDSPFELEEVSSALPEVRCYNANDMDKLLSYDEFDVPVTKEAVNRRSYYRTQQNFKKDEKEWQEERLDFLKNCQMVLNINKPEDAQIERCYELIQRTNQLNLSARQYNRKEFVEMLSDERFECFVLRFKDKFGEYGIVGVAVVKLAEKSPELIELAISCRVARRKVEQSFISWLANRYAQKDSEVFLIRMRATNRNGLLAHAFEELDFKKKAVAQDLIEWMIPLHPPLPEQSIISIIYK